MADERHAAIRRAVEAVRSHASRSVEYLTREPDYAVVRKLNPLEVELSSSAMTLDSEQLVVTQHVREYDLRHGLKVGDAVKVSLMRNGDWLVEHVIAPKDTFGGVEPSAQVVDSADPTYEGSGSDPQGGTVDVTVTPDHHIVKKVAYLDEDGNVVGWLPIYGSLP